MTSLPRVNKHAYPRVTTIVTWAVRDESYVNPYFLRRGTWNHAACDIVGVTGTLAGLDDATVAFGTTAQRNPITQECEEWMRFVISYMGWMDKAVPHQFVRIIREADTGIINEVERYRGTPDQVWEMADGKQAIIDLKTNVAPPWTALQVAAYDLGLPLAQRRRRFALELKAGKPARLIEYTNSRDYDAWRLLVRAWWVAQEYSK